MRASSAYIAANNGLPSPGFAERLPYFDPPLEPVIVQTILDAEAAGKK